jgi:protease IV
MTLPDNNIFASAAPAPSSRPTWDVTAERLVQDLLKERRKDRRWRIFFRLMGLLLLLLVLFASFASSHRTSSVASTGGPHTALIEVRGEIAAGAEASVENLLPALKSAFEDVNAKAVVLRIDSPGGSPVQSGIINTEIYRLKKLHKKKVYAVVDESCASGAYYIAVAADEIYADKASLVGSIGVLMDSFGATGLMEKLGVERRLLTAGANKGIGDPFSPLPSKQREHLQTMLNQIHQQFIAVVREGRGTRLKETPDMFSGLFWNGEQALSLGLIDKLGSLDFVVREVIKTDEVVDYTLKENVAERLAKRFGAAMGAGAVKALRNTTAIH